MFIFKIVSTYYVYISSKAKIKFPSPTEPHRKPMDFNNRMQSTL